MVIIDKKEIYFILLVKKHEINNVVLKVNNFLYIAQI